MTGARRSQLLALRWSDVDFDHAAIGFCRALVDGPTGPVLGPTKNRRTYRVALDPTSVELLVAHALSCSRLSDGFDRHSGRCPPLTYPRVMGGRGGDRAGTVSIGSPRSGWPDHRPLALLVPGPDSAKFIERRARLASGWAGGLDHVGPRHRRGIRRRLRDEVR